MKKWKKVLCSVIAGIMVAALPVQAAVVDQEVKAAIETNDIPPWPKASDLMAESGLLMEFSTGTVIYSKGGDQRISPTGITKLMTILLAVENSALTDQVTFADTCLAKADPESNLGLMAGETLTMEQCLKIMVLDKAYEVAAQVAENLGPSEAQFVAKMNERAKAIGCENTNFTNAGGISDPNQYTTARDMTKIFREGLKNKVFRKIIRTSKLTVGPTNLNGMERSLPTYHPIRSKHSSLFDPDCMGGLFSVSQDAGSSLATAVKKNGVIYISVVLNDVDINQAGVDTQYLMKYGYENFQKISVEGGSVVIPNGMSVADLQISERKSGDKVRQFYAVDNYRVGRGVKQAAVPAPEVRSDEQITEGQTEGTKQTPVEEAKENGLSDTARMLLGVMAVMVLILIILCILLAIKDHKERRYYED